MDSCASARRLFQQRGLAGGASEDSRTAGFQICIRWFRLTTLKREVTVFRFLRESLGERADFVRIFEWNFDQHPYFLESEYGGPNLAQWAESQGGLAKVLLQIGCAWLPILPRRLRPPTRQGCCTKT